MNRSAFLLIFIAVINKIHCSNFVFTNSFYDNQMNIENVAQKPLGFKTLELSTAEHDEFYPQAAGNPRLTLVDCDHFVWTSPECRNTKVLAASENCRTSKVFLKIDSDQEGHALWEEIATIALFYKDKRLLIQDWTIALNHPLNYATLCHCPETDGKIAHIDYLSTDGIIITFEKGRKVKLNLVKVGEDHGTPCYQWLAEHFCKVIISEDPGTLDNLHEIHDNAATAMDGISTSDELMPYTEIFFGMPIHTKCLTIEKSQRGHSKSFLQDQFGVLYILSKTDRWRLESTLYIDDLTDDIIFNIYLKLWPGCFCQGIDWDPFDPSGITFSVPSGATDAIKECGRTPGTKTPLKLALLPSGSLCNR